MYFFSKASSIDVLLSITELHLYREYKIVLLVEVWPVKFHSKVISSLCMSKRWLWTGILWWYQCNMGKKIRSDSTGRSDYRHSWQSLHSLFWDIRRNGGNSGVGGIISLRNCFNFLPLLQATACFTFSRVCIASQDLCNFMWAIFFSLQHVVNKLVERFLC